VALAAGAGDVLAQATVYESLAQALHGVQLAFATTGYAREFGALPLEVRAAAQECAQVVLEPAAEIAAASRVETAVASATASTAGSASTVRAAGKPAGAVAFVFGPERTGLSNADVQRCHQCCSIPADPVRGSLNLSQAAQVVAYETRREILAAAGTHDTPAPRRDLDPAEPKHLLARIRRLLLRARPTVTEVDILRGIASAMVLPRRLRAGSKKMRDGD
jgi:tRNA/rRNA methyltransferase